MIRFRCPCSSAGRQLDAFTSLPCFQRPLTSPLSRYHYQLRCCFSSGLQMLCSFVFFLYSYSHMLFFLFSFSTASWGCKCWMIVWHYVGQPSGRISPGVSANLGWFNKYSDSSSADFHCPWPVRPSESPTLIISSGPQVSCGHSSPWWVPFLVVR